MDSALPGLLLMAVLSSRTLLLHIGAAMWMSGRSAARLFAVATIARSLVASPKIVDIPRTPHVCPALRVIPS